MNVIQFELLSCDDWRQFVVAIDVDGESLIDRVARIESAQRRTRRLEPWVSKYQWARAERLLLPQTHLLAPPAIDFCEGLSELLVCTCGEVGCGALAVSIQVWPRHIGWLAWRQFPLREMLPPLDFPALLFDRQQYEVELERVSALFHTLKT